MAQIRADLAGRALREEVAAQDGALRAFYLEHPPLWLVGGAVRPEARALINLTGPDPALEAVVERSSRGSPSDLAQAEIALSSALVKVALAARNSSARVVFADKALAPPRDGLEALRAAARAPSLAAHLQSLGGHSPLYAELAAARRGRALSPEADARVQANLDRLRSLPPDLGDRFVLVDIPAARLWLYEQGEPVHSMRVVVGSPGDPTPLMAAALRSAVINPYWNLPPDLVSQRIAPQVIRSGPGALEDLDMEVLSGWTRDAQRQDPDSVDWPAVSRGMVIRVRQRPGPDNTLGRVKFVMPNNLGIYLHDTPERRRLSARTPFRSAGCVRVADADLLGRWLLGAAWRPSEQHEAKLSLAKPVPVYIVYRTARVQNGAIRFLPDPYGLDAAFSQGRSVMPRHRPSPALGRAARLVEKVHLAD